MRVECLGVRRCRAIRKQVLVRALLRGLARVENPRRLGIAAHMGLLLDVPTIGCAKTLLTGTYKEPAKKRGSLAPLRAKDEVIGTDVRTRDKVKPLFVSVGHKIDQASAIRLVLECCRGYRLPEPTRQAHIHVNALRRSHKSKLS